MKLARLKEILEELEKESICSFPDVYVRTEKNVEEVIALEVDDEGDLIIITT